MAKRTQSAASKKKTTRKRSTRAASSARGPKGAKSAATTPKKRSGATRAKQGARKPKAKKRGILDAAADILVKSGEPMSCKQIVEQAIAAGMWTTKGKTPQATLYAAIVREIERKGKQARFEKVDRGRFIARKGAQ